jgi:ribosomal-protein-serine acetyltransferase
MSTLNDLVYQTISGKSGTSLDGLREAFCGIFQTFDTPENSIEVTRIGKSVLFHSGFDLAYLNQAVLLDSSPEILEEILRQVSSWQVKCSITLAGAGLEHAEALRLRGFSADGATPLMAFAIDDSFSAFELRSGLRAERTSSKLNLDTNIDLISKTFGMERETVAGLMLASIDSAETYRYILFDEDVPVSTCLFIANGDVVGCFDVATPVEHQRKGYGEELMKYMAQEQAKLNRKLIILQATNAGEALYRRMGFQIIEYQQVWTMDKPVRLSRFEMLDINIGPYRLRQLTENDEELILKNFAEEAFQKWMGMPIPFLKENFLNFLKFSQDQYLNGVGLWWVIEEDGAPLGQIWLMRQDWIEKKTEIGYLAYPEARGKGMIPFLTRELTRKLLLEYEMERVELTTHSLNDTSGHVAKKAGFRLEGTMRRVKKYRDDIIDMNLYSMIASDFESSGK